MGCHVTGISELAREYTLVKSSWVAVSALWSQNSELALDLSYDSDSRHAQSDCDA